MANPYTQIYIQAVFAVQNRMSLLRKEYKELLEDFEIDFDDKYIFKGIV